MAPEADERARPSRRLLAALALFVLAFGAAGYAWLGSRAGWGIPAGGARAFAASLGADDAEGWTRMARAYGAAGRYPDAVAMWQRVLALKPNDAQSLADAADAIASAGGRQTLEGEPERLLAKALQLDPDNLKALVLAGRAAFDRGDAQAAVAHWQRALARIPPESDFARELKGALAVATQGAHAKAGGEAAVQPAAGAGSAVVAGESIAAAPAAASVQGQVSLAPSLAARVSPDDTLFVFARAVEGPKVPLAVLRKKARELPFAFTLDDSMAMNPALRLSTAQRVVIGARISKSGSALSQPGDLQVLSPPVQVGARDVRLEIAEVVP